VENRGGVFAVGVSEPDHGEAEPWKYTQSRVRSD
jgi:hypothetical protein